VIQVDIEEEDDDEDDESNFDGTEEAALVA
jgi:hypothetical protein